MPKRYYAQRKHIISSLDTLLYQLHVISFFASPSIWILLFRLLAQQQCTRTKELDPGRSLRFYYGLILLCNGYALWSHATSGASQGRSVILDFVGMPYIPSKLQLILLDTTIIFLKTLLATIAYEVNIIENSDSPDTLLPPIHTLPLTGNDVLDLPNSRKSEAAYIVDLSISQVLKRLRESSSPATAASSRESALPLPNTTPWSMPMSIMRARAQSRRATTDGTIPINVVRSVPGGLSSESS